MCILIGIIMGNLLSAVSVSFCVCIIYACWNRPRQTIKTDDYYHYTFYYNVFRRLVGSVPNLILIIKRFYLNKHINLFDIIFRFMSRNIYDAPVLYESLGFVIAWRPIQNVQSTV